MMKRFTFLATLALAVSSATGAWAQSSGQGIGFSGYTQTSGPDSVSYTRTAADMGGPLPVTLTADATVFFAITQPDFLINPLGPQNYLGAILSLTAQSSSMVVTTGSSNTQDGFAGMFSITDSTGTVNLLSGTFTQAIMSQIRPNLVSFETNFVSFESDIFLPTFDEDFILGFSGGINTLAVSQGAFENFTANRTSGDFNALVIPEPASLAMAGFGVLGLPLALRVVRRRRSVTSN